MSIWGKLFGSDKAIGSIIDGVYNGVDALVFTPQEKAERFERLLKLYEPFKIAQRFLALLVGIPFVFIHTMAGLAWLTSIFIVTDKVYLVLLERLGDIMTYNNATLGQPFSLIIGFYFAGGMIEGGIKAFQSIKK